MEADPLLTAFETYKVLKVLTPDESFQTEKSSETDKNFLVNKTTTTADDTAETNEIVEDEESS